MDEFTYTGSKIKNQFTAYLLAQIRGARQNYLRKMLRISSNEMLAEDLTVEEIGTSAFSGCKKLKKMVIPESVKNVEGYAFMDCEDLEEVVFEGKLEEIGYDVFLRSNPQISGLNLPLKNSGGHRHSS